MPIPDVSPQPPELGSSQARIAGLLASLWTRNLPEIKARLSVLDRAALSATNGALAPELRQEAISVAHKLAGSLGMYGYTQASEVARLLEQTLTGEINLADAHLLDHTEELRRALGL